MTVELNIERLFDLILIQLTIDMLLNNKICNVLQDKKNLRCCRVVE